MATSTASPEQRELSLIGKVEMRIALADSDNKLESTLKTYLAPLLLKLASEHASVRNKVVAVCQHINTRVRPQSIQLPVAALVKQFKEQESSLIRNFDLIYIQQGVGRLSANEKAELLPVVIKDISSSGSHGPQIFNLLLRLLEYYTLPVRGSKEDTDLRLNVGVSSADTNHLATWIGKFVLYNPSAAIGHTAPGLTSEDCSFLSLQGKEDLWNVSSGGINLLRTKALAAKLLASGFFTDAERFLPALYASADTASNLSDVGDDMMKRALPATDLEDEELIHHLYRLYFGEQGRPRVKAPLRMKILGLLIKSVKSTTFSNQIAKLVDDGLTTAPMDGEDTFMTNGSTASSKAGREATKLRASVFAYINFVARSGSKDTLQAIASNTVSKLRDYIEAQGWPKLANGEDLVSRGYAYEVIGLLAKAGPSNVLVEDDYPAMDVLRWLFDSLAKDSAGNTITVSIEDSLSSVLTALARMQLSSEAQASLEDLLVDQMTLSDDLKANDRLRSTSYVAIRFANRCLPYNSVKARWVDILGVGAKGDRIEVREEAERGLSPYWYQMINGSLSTNAAASHCFPSFVEVVSQFFAGRTINEDTEPQVLALRTAERRGATVAHMAAFCRRLLFHEGLKESASSPPVEEEWERKLDALIENDDESRRKISAYIEALPVAQMRALETVLFAEFQCLLQPTSNTEDSLVTLLALCPATIGSKLSSHAADLVPMVTSNNVTKRRVAANAFGTLVSYLRAPSGGILQAIERMSRSTLEWEKAFGATVNQIHGSILALGFLFSRQVLRGAEEPNKSTHQQLVKTTLEILAGSKDNLLKEATFVALGQLAMANALPIDAFGTQGGARRVIDQLYEAAKAGSEPAILCLGQVSMLFAEGDSTSDDSLHHLMQCLHKLHEVRQAEIHFSVGEALSCVALGWKSKVLATKLDVNISQPTFVTRERTLPELLEQTLKDCSSSKPALRKASVIWLLCLVQFCGEAVEVQTRLPQCQAAFKRCLSDRDELVQETASRGLGLVYEKGDRNLKDDLVRDLVNSFSSDKQSQLAGSVSADTQLFEPGALPTGDGSVSTYKDIMSLASEVGDSSLVYKFMSMASSNAIWSSRAAFGRFGLSNVLSDSGVDGYLSKNPKLYPKLFRYRFDPNGGVQRAMNDIWNALVKDTSATIDQHFDAIMEDLLTSILGKEWRVRQACCAAIADLVQGRPIENYEKYLERIWQQAFKVLDDIKESVRAAAASLARVLTNVLTRTLEADNSAAKSAAVMLKHVLPFLLSPSGMESSAQETQVFAVHTLLEIIKKASGPTLRPFIPELVERLVGLLSSLEPEAVNYIHLNASKYNLTEQKIDDMRLSSVRSSPIMEAIERCLDLLDDPTMAHLSPKLQSAMKSAVGLPSKVGSSRILVSLSTRRMHVFRPFADDYLKLIEKLVLDRNETVAASYAVSAGYVSRLATDKQMLRLATFCKKLYFESESDREASVPRRSITSGDIMHALVKYASDRFSALASSLLPFVYVAKHDSNELVREPFSETWEEAVGGSRVVLLYLKEILEICNTHLDSPQWTLKHTAARTIADAVETVAGQSSAISEDMGTLLWPALERALGGKTWDGKEIMLPALVKFVERGQAFYLGRAEVASAIVKIAYREAKRQNEAYRPHAVKALGQIVRARTDIDPSIEVFSLVTPLLQSGDDNGDAMDVDEGTKSVHTSRKEEVAAHGAGALLAAINPKLVKGEVLESKVVQHLSVIASSPDKAVPAVQRSVFDGVKELFERIRAADQGPSLTHKVIDVLRTAVLRQEVGTEVLRLKRADAVMTGAKCSSQLAAVLQEDIIWLSEHEASGVVRERLAAARV